MYIINEPKLQDDLLFALDRRLFALIWDFF